ncbi:MAG: class III extradiol ring-cleavage dioxygenase, partial [Pseudomonadota bacterium]
LAQRVIRTVNDAGFAATADATRGLDHGAWVPLSLVYPDARVPVVQLSMDARRDARWHAALGRALAPLREDGVLILASGGATHNLRALFRPGGLPPADAPAPRWVRTFADWLADGLAANDKDRMIDTWRDAPHALDNHPTPEHLLPLFVAMGAGGTASCLHRSTTHGVLAMDAYAFA